MIRDGVNSTNGVKSTNSRVDIRVLMINFSSVVQAGIQAILANDEGIELVGDVPDVWKRSPCTQESEDCRKSLLGKRGVMSILGFNERSLAPHVA